MCDSLVLMPNNYVLPRLLQVWFLYVFSNFQWFFQNLFMNLKKKFFLKSSFTSFLSFVLILMYGFNQVFWLNSTTLDNLFDTNPWLNTCLKFLMRLKYYFLSSSLLKVSETLPIHKSDSVFLSQSLMYLFVISFCIE